MVFVINLALVSCSKRYDCGKWFFSRYNNVCLLDLHSKKKVAKLKKNLGNFA
jgi:hypothetical protein